MKTITLKWVIFMLLLLPHTSKAQEIHHQLELFFSNHSLAVFESDLGFVPDDHANQLKLEKVNANYDIFFSEIHGKLTQGAMLSTADLEMEYAELVDATKASLKQLPNQSFSGTPKVLDGPCVNMDFETGDLSGWDLTRGDVDGSAPYSFVSEFPVLPGPYHQIFGGGVDPVTGIPRVNPISGAFSTRLGNGTGTGARAARMKQTFLVDATNFIFTYSYAVIFESPAGHTLNQLPYFTVRVFDELGNSVPCGEYSVIADAANASNFQTVISGGETVLFQNWQTVFTNLSAYIGQNVTVEFTSGDCSLSGHYGYAYVDASCSMSQIITSASTICNGQTAVLTAPPGAASYSWSNGANTQSTTVSAGGTYSCTLTPFQGGGCSIVLDITIIEYPTPIASFTSITEICAGESISFTDASTIPAPGTIVNYRWDFGDGIVTPIGSGALLGVPQTVGTYLLPTHTYTTAGAYTVELWVQSADGCEDVFTLPILVNPLPNVGAGADQTVCIGTAVTLNGTGATSYAWDNGITNGVSFTPAVGTMTYTVTGTDANGCANTDQVNVTVNPLPIVNAGADQTVCIGTAVTLNGSGATNYAWDNGIMNGVAFVPVVGTMTYTVTGSDANGCVNTDQVNVTANPLPIVNAGTDQTVCEGTTVILNGAGATSYAWDNGITNGVAFVPAVGTITYTVMGTDANGCVNTDQVNVTVNPLPIVNAGADQTVCIGMAVTLNGSGAINYAWDNGITNGVAFIPAVGTLTYTVTGTDANGCVNTDQVNVTVNPLPIVNAGADQTVCIGTAVTLNGSGATNYAWDNGIINGVAFIPVVGAMIYTVTGTDANGCLNTDQVNVTVNPLPIVNAGTDQTVCEGTAVTLNGAGATSYAWDNGITNGLAFVPAVGTITYTVTGSDANGCVNTDQVNVTVNPLPIVNAGADQTVCEGTAVTLNGSGASNYSWNNGISNGVAFVQAVGTMTYTVNGTDIHSCSNSDQVVVVVNPLPIVDAGADQTVCEGTPIMFSAIGTPQMSWNNGVVNNVPFTQAIGTVVYTLTDSYATGCSASDQVLVTVHPNPIVTAEDKEICAGEGVTLSGSGAMWYSWTGGVQDGVEFFPTQTSEYTVTGTNNFGCSATALAKVTVNALPIADFRILDLSLTTISSGTGFENLSIGASTYDWNFGDGSATSNEFEPFHEFPNQEAGSYEVTLIVTSPEGCIDDRVKYVYVSQDYTIYVPNAFTPDGNGANEVFKPVMEGFDEDDYVLYIFNRWGELVFESHDMNVGWDGEYSQLDENVQDGVFTWKIIAGLKDSGDSKIFVGHVSLLK